MQVQMGFIGIMGKIWERVKYFNTKLQNDNKYNKYKYNCKNYQKIYRSYFINLELSFQFFFLYILWCLNIKFDVNYDI